MSNFKEYHIAKPFYQFSKDFQKYFEENNIMDRYFIITPSFLDNSEIKNLNHQIFNNINVNDDEID